MKYVSEGASLADPSGFFNSSLKGNTSRAIDFYQGDKIDGKGVEGAGSSRRGTQHVGASSQTPKQVSQTILSVQSRLCFGSAGGTFAQKGSAAVILAAGAYNPTG